ncbi:MAG: bifunctional (p)ppGpp synthetase/guanosine-3',5'-bis(diphosphate) 3'-pyrophosphohydrolase [Abitibacteriaceae bacterium]|nr:bifunctional (p)ppGpp synthetase/guanosine-3',5'-bis(diphosphate) 3'-pyrophosphohydrolase [Abditibacteriaceae bacterium]MBV9865189.1 bifunctional (p)ppGpp synthetase/guanosine-3',5'-bis(diphosphate) 3'-pyrophosphohydrolase [Abditibacteriaceae bacterium]
MPNLKDAIALATVAHRGQVDKAGAEYIEHPLRVMHSVQGEEVQIVAVLHDVIEDTPVTLEALRQAGYSPAIIEAVELLTRREQDSYEAFIERVANNPLVRQVKIADLQDNLRIERIAEPTQQDYQRLEKYRRALNVLQS